jgi:SH3-like domain-containing protein
MQKNPIKSMIKLGSAQFLLLCAALAFSCAANAIDYRSIAPAKAISYDAPSLQSDKLYILNSGYPVEIIVNLDGWVKVRDALGGLSWVESKALSTKRTVLVTAKTEIKSAEDAASNVVATVDKDVVLELLSPTIKNGWVKVKHRDGITGFVQAINTWGLN